MEIVWTIKFKQEINIGYKIKIAKWRINQNKKNDDSRNHKMKIGNCMDNQIKWKINVVH